MMSLSKLPRTSCKQTTGAQVGIAASTQALQAGVLTAPMLEHLTSEQSEWLLGRLAATNGKHSGCDGDGSGPVAAGMAASDQHAALADFLVGASASGEQLSSQHYGCLAAHCEVRDLCGVRNATSQPQISLWGNSVMGNGLFGSSSTASTAAALSTNCHLGSLEYIHSGTLP